jgi:hypothetical protein
MNVKMARIVKGRDGSASRLGGFGLPVGRQAKPPYLGRKDFKGCAADSPPHKSIRCGWKSRPSDWAMIPSGRRKLEAPESSVVKLKYNEVKTMSKHLKLTFCMAVLVMMLMAASSFAVPTVCDAPIYKGSAPYTPLKIAVAANFYQPVEDLVSGYTLGGTTYPGFLDQISVDNVAVYICQNSTGVLESEILAGLQSVPTQYVYDYFFAADGISSTFLTAASPYVPYSPFLYAHGVPVLFGYTTGKTNTITNVGNLVVGLGSGTQYTVAQADSDLYALNFVIGTNSVAVADAVNAPYGTAAQDIFAEFATPPTTTPQFSTIGTTFNAVGTTQGSYAYYAGVVSRAQICDIKPSIAYVEFTGYTLNQRALQLTANGSALNTYIQGQMYPAWNTFLTNHCYSTIS